MEIPRYIVFLVIGLCSLYLFSIQGIDPYFPFTKKVSMQLTGSSTVYSSADRAIVYVHISSEGTKQSRVSDEIRSTLNEVMSLLRPLSRSNSTTGVPIAIKDISVNELESNSWQRDTIIGQATMYTGKAIVQSEFSDIESLGVVLSKLSKMPRLKVESIKWRLSDELKAKVSAESREKAMQDLLAKGRAYVKPLGLQHLRASSIHENSHSIRAVRESGCNAGWNYHSSRKRLASMAPRYQMGMGEVHDELGLDSRWSPEEIEQSYEMESRSLEISAHVSASCEAY